MFPCLCCRVSFYIYSVDFDVFAIWHFAKDLCLLTLGEIMSLDILINSSLEIDNFRFSRYEYARSGTSVWTCLYPSKLALHFLAYFVLQPALIQPSDNQLSLADFDAVQVIGKGNGGVVRLVQHKWTAQFFALKVLMVFILLCLVYLKWNVEFDGCSCLIDMEKYIWE